MSEQAQVFIWVPLIQDEYPFTPRTSSAKYAATDGKPAKLRGHTAASVPGEWLANDGVDAAGQTRCRRGSILFDAMHRDGCDASLTAPEPRALALWGAALELCAIGRVVCASDKLIQSSL